MRKSLIVLLLFIFLGCSQSQIPILFSQDYIFLTVDGGADTVKQSNDTLYQLYQLDATLHESRSKIISTYKMGEFTILKLKDLDIDTIPFGDRNLCPGKPYSIVAFKSINNRQLEYDWPVFACLTKYQLDTTKINKSLLERQSFLTYFSESYLKELSSLKKVSTKDDYKTIVDAIEGNDFDSGKIEYSAEQLTKACIEKGYNPVGAGPALDSIWDKIVRTNMSLGKPDGQ
ncbi:MAG TPA: hypothetical protein VE978_11525 [Chitinophagales bacterium]|nr:hypothetical protein [Chitinophagales bacterium]